MSLVSASLLVIIRMYVSFHSYKPGPSFPNEALIKAFSIAIWSKNTIAVAIGVITWVTNVSVIIQGKFSSTPCELSRIPHQRGFLIGVARVSNQLQLRWTT